ncbi:MAG: hypothetical protein HY363_02025 [Candidatus Aenigmarchaeota archaeon]|nr:hypothetical protein [Candidatus Aenigmarchaeota archaeon]
MSLQVTVRDVNEEVFKEFKANAVQRGLKLGSALTLAMEKFMSQKRKTKFTALKPVAWGKGTEHASDEVDSILYGEQYDFH